MEKTKERQYLSNVITAIEERIGDMEHTIDSNEQSYREIQKYTVDYKNELDKYEVYNFHQNMNYIDKRNVLESGVLRKLNYQKEVPYFAKIGFRFEGEDDQEEFYIGRFGFADKYSEQLVYDWRAPISSLYYDFNLGPAAYESFGKTFPGSISLKRQYEIENQTLKWMMDTEESLNDDFLLKELGKNTSNEMKTIIHTIQREQNEVIRDLQTKNLIIQGVAGSGKTSIALHRIAYLLYRQRESLKSEHVLILSPNRIFADYISTVLPELGEEDLQQVDITTLGQRFIDEKLQVSSRQDEITEILENSASDKSENYRYKRSGRFFEQAKNYLNKLKERLYFEDLQLSENLTIDKVSIQSVVRQSRETALLPLIKQIAVILGNTIENRQPSKQEAMAKTIEQQLKKRIRIKNSLQEYNDFLKKLPSVYHSSGKKDDLANCDLFPYLFFMLEIEGIKPAMTIKHLVIDEMQDYSLLQLYVLNQLFPNEKTICGDVNQNLTEENHQFLDELNQLLPKSRIAEFQVSYRSSFEIIEFAKAFTTNQQLTAVERHGKPVTVERADDNREKLMKIRNAAAAFLEGPHKTCGIICQNWEEVAALEMELTDYPVTKFGKNTNKMAEGIILTTVQFAKGLEFDEVILPDITQEQLKEKSNSIYTSCSRALHELIVLVAETGKGNK
ncbi:AAA family ATPase [Enterococcus sp. BWM-S5]|uniref:AAA family ATPase n=1 Tax=Enterococcus larvae TaxID=2794352 RepID=A0ABS4CEW2_9ENTE|nr:UvrD-helicase domain-containing protein [Enterococcus larvae]MBP1045168.1 AAA family ATPase [Enterococcus larvae]